MNRGIAYYAMGAYIQALQDFNRAIELQPGDASAYNNRGYAHFSIKEYGKAWADVRTCRQLGGRPNPALVAALTRATGRSE